MEITVSGYFVSAVLEGVLKQDYPVVDWLEQLDIPRDILDYPEKRVTSQQFTQLVQLLWQHTQDEYMGFFPQRSKPGTFYLMCLTMIHGDNLKVFFDRSIRFYDLITENFRLELEVEHDRARFKIHSIQAVVESNFLIEALLAVWHRFASWLCGKQIHLSQASFSFSKPNHVDEYSALFFCPTCFNQKENFIEFSSHSLSLPMVQSEKSLRKFLQKSPFALIFRLSMSDSLSTKVRHLLSQKPLDFNLSSTQLAEKLNMSPPTLRRKLKDEGTSFQAIRDNLRRDIALANLEKRHSIEEVCELTGFSDPSAFYRAFKRWTGFTPNHYLRNNS